MHSLGEWQTLVSKAHSLWKSRRKPTPQPDRNQRQHPEFLFLFQVPSFGNCRQLLSHYPSGLLVPGCCLASGSFLRMVCKPLQPMATWPQGHKFLQMHWPVCSPGGQESVPFFPWDYISFRYERGQVLPQHAQISLHSGRVQFLLFLRLD